MHQTNFLRQLVLHQYFLLQDDETQVQYYDLQDQLHNPLERTRYKKSFKSLH